MESPTEWVEVGDMVEVRRGSHAGKTGIVVTVKWPAGTLTFVLPDSAYFRVPIDAVTFTLDCRVLQFSPDRSSDVKQGDTIVVIRGDYRGKYRMVTRVCLDNKVLHIDPLGSPGVSNINVTVIIALYLWPISLLSSFLSPTSCTLSPPVVTKISNMWGKRCWSLMASSVDGEGHWSTWHEISAPCYVESSSGTLTPQTTWSSSEFQSWLASTASWVIIVVLKQGSRGGPWHRKRFV